MKNYIIVFHIIMESETELKFQKLVYYYNFCQRITRKGCPLVRTAHLLWHFWFSVWCPWTESTRKIYILKGKWMFLSSKKKQNEIYSNSMLKVENPIAIEWKFRAL